MKAVIINQKIFQEKCPYFVKDIFFMWRAVFFLSLFVLPLFSCGQGILDSLRSAVQTKPKFNAGISSRYSFVDNSQAKITGYRLGVDFGHKIKIGGGFFILDKAIFKPVTFRDINARDTTVSAGLHLKYLAYYFEYIFYNSPRWEFSVPFQLGVGDSYYQYVHREEKNIISRRKVVIYESGISFHYKIFKWLGAGADVGVRLMVKNNKDIHERLNSPTYAFKILVWYDELFKAIFPNSELLDKF